MCKEGFSMEELMDEVKPVASKGDVEIYSCFSSREELDKYIFNLSWNLELDYNRDTLEVSSKIGKLNWTGQFLDSNYEIDYNTFKDTLIIASRLPVDTLDTHQKVEILKKINNVSEDILFKPAWMLEIHSEKDGFTNLYSQFEKYFDEFTLQAMRVCNYVSSSLDSGKPISEVYVRNSFLSLDVVYNKIVTSVNDMTELAKNLGHPLDDKLEDVVTRSLNDIKLASQIDKRLIVELRNTIEAIHDNDPLWYEKTMKKTRGLLSLFEKDKQSVDIIGSFILTADLLCKCKADFEQESGYNLDKKKIKLIEPNYIFRRELKQFVSTLEERSQQKRIIRPFHSRKNNILKYKEKEHVHSNEECKEREN